MSDREYAGYRCADLPPELWAWWRERQRSEPTLASPYFTPAFTREVAAVRDDVRILAAFDDKGPVALLPVQVEDRVAWPVGAPANDYHGLIASPEAEVDMHALLAAVGVTTWHFDHWIVSQRRHAPFAHHRARCPWIDLREGYETFATRLRKETNLISKEQAKLRKLARRVGPVEFTWNDQEPDLLPTLIRWKREQYVATSVIDVLAADWLVELLGRLRTLDDRDLAGVMSVCRSGDQIAAMHFGVRCRNVLHSWFPVYNPELSAFSPGFNLVLQILEEAPRQGVTRFDFGRGEEDYKYRLRPHIDWVAEGAVDIAWLPQLSRAAWSGFKQSIAASPFGPLARNLWRSLAGWLGIGGRGVALTKGGN